MAWRRLGVSAVTRPTLIDPDHVRIRPLTSPPSLRPPSITALHTGYVKHLTDGLSTRPSPMLSHPRYVLGR